MVAKLLVIPSEFFIIKHHFSIFTHNIPRKRSDFDLDFKFLFIYLLKTSNLAEHHAKIYWKPDSFLSSGGGGWGRGGGRMCKLVAWSSRGAEEASHRGGPSTSWPHAAPKPVCTPHLATQHPTL